MNALKITLAFFLISICVQLNLLGQSCDPALCKSPQKGATSATVNSNNLAQFMSLESAKTATITFEKGKLIEVALFAITPGKESQINEDYFPKVFPVAMEYGLKPMQMFAIQEKTYGECPAEMVGFF